MVTVFKPFNIKLVTSLHRHWNYTFDAHEIDLKAARTDSFSARQKHFKFLVTETIEFAAVTQKNTKKISSLVFH